MNSAKMIMTSLLTGLALGILFAPSKEKVVPKKLYKGKNSYKGKLNKELKKFDKAVKKQIKSAKREIADLIENQYRTLSNPDL